MFRNRAEIFCLFTLIFAFLWVLPVDAEGWFSHDSGVTNDLRAVDFLDFYSGFAVGDSGTILKKSFGDWSSPQSSGVTAHLYDVDMVYSSTVYVVGVGGTILKTTNGGASWVQQSSGTTATLNAVKFVTGNANVGYAVGSSGLILKTTNGGSSWVALTSGTTNDLNDIDISPASSSVIWAVGENYTVLYSDNSGSTWTQKTSSAGGIDIQAIELASSNTALALFYSTWSKTVMRSIDGGAEWSAVSDSTLNVLSEIDLASGGLLGFVVGSGGVFLKTENGGTSWNTANSQSNSLYGVKTMSLRSFAVGAGGTILEYDETPPSKPGDLTKTTPDSDNTPAFQWSESVDESGYSSSYLGSGIAKYEYAIDGGSYVDNGLNITLHLGDVLSDAPHVIQVRAVDNVGNVGDYAYLAFAINATSDTEAPVGSISINGGAATTNSTSVTLNLSCTDNVSCALMQVAVDGTADTESWGIYLASPSATLSSGDGTKTVAVRFKDGAGKISAQYTDTIVLSTAVADTTAPVVGAISPVTATVNSAQSFTASYSDNVGVTSCGLFVNDIPQEGAMSLSGTTSGTATKSYTFSSVGSYAVKVNCTDGTNTTWGAATTVVVSAAGELDTTAPLVGSVTPTTAIATYSQSFTVSYSDTVGVTSCNLYVDSTDQGPMTLAGTTSGSASRIYSFSNTTSHTLQARCSDAVGNVGLGALTTVSVSAVPASPADTTAPSTPPGLQKVSNDADATPTFAWNATSDNIGVTSYLIQIDNGSLIDNGGSTSYTVPSNLSNGSHTFKVLAKDAAGNSSAVASFSFTVNTSTPAPTPVSCSLTINGAYKLTGSPAVYYITDECNKRPFSKSNVFFTYFDSWSDVKVVTKTKLDKIPLDTLGFMPWGPKYDPKYGALVKIVSDPKVYLLLGGEKYWIIEEDIFEGLKYKWDWIEDIDKKLLDKYVTGSEIDYTDHHPNYTLVKYASSSKVYRLEPDPADSDKQVKRHIKNEKVFNALNFRWDRIVTISKSETYKDGDELDEGDV